MVILQDEDGNYEINQDICTTKTPTDNQVLTQIHNE